MIITFDFLVKLKKTITIKKLEKKFLLVIINSFFILAFGRVLGIIQVLSLRSSRQAHDYN